MAEAAIESLPDDERESVRSGTSAIRHRMAGEDSVASPALKRKLRLQPSLLHQNQRNQQLIDGWIL